ncbi:metal ABC transporter permease [candidate division KSB1 bacterium]
MTDAILFMILPFLACLLLVGINIYFGIHVIKREIIFIDIAMAQIAALGTTFSVVFPVELTSEWGVAEYTHGSNIEYYFSLVFVVLAAAAFTFLKSEKLAIPIEALIGIAYAVAATGAVILIDKAAGGDVHVHEMLEGSILWVTWGDILKLFIVFLLVGGFHYIFREKFFRLSDIYLESGSDKKVSALWDFLFYLTFGIVVVHAVNVGGILTVFTFLIIPASISILFAETWMSRILIGWVIGTIVTVCGLYLSWILDVPSSPTVILFLGVFLLLALVVKSLGFFKLKEKQAKG